MNVNGLLVTLILPGLANVVLMLIYMAGIAPLFFDDHSYWILRDTSIELIPSHFKEMTTTPEFDWYIWVFPVLNFIAGRLTYKVHADINGLTPLKFGILGCVGVFATWFFFNTNMAFIAGTTLLIAFLLAGRRTSASRSD